MGSVFLMGGGWDAAVLGRHLGAFLAAAGPDPDVACLVVDEGAGHGQGEATRWSAALTAAGVIEAQVSFAPRRAACREQPCPSFMATAAPVPGGGLLGIRGAF